MIQEFNLDKKSITNMKGSVIFFLSMIVLSVSLPFLPNEGQGSSQGALWVSFGCTVIFGFFTIYSWISLKKLPYVDIVIDEEGLWYKHKSKNAGLVPWNAIANLNERSWLQCLDVLDANGQKLLRVEYQLDRFEALRELLTTRVGQHKGQVKLPCYFSKRLDYHLFTVSVLLGFLIAGLYVAIMENNPVMGYLGTAVLLMILINEYLVTPYRVVISGNELTITYPLRSGTVKLSDIISVNLVDAFHQGARHPEVWVATKRDRKPFKLKQLGVDANVLFLVLDKARQQFRDDSMHPVA